MKDILKNSYKKTIENIVNKKGGYREKEVLKNNYTVERGTWNKDHKVLEVVSEVEEEDGYRSGFAVDLVTCDICG